MNLTLLIKLTLYLKFTFTVLPGVLDVLALLKLLQISLFCSEVCTSSSMLWGGLAVFRATVDACPLAG